MPKNRECDGSCGGHQENLGTGCLAGREDNTMAVPKISLCVTEPLGCQRNDYPEPAQDYYVDFFYLKLPATDSGMASAVELMDPFQTAYNRDYASTRFARDRYMAAIESLNAA